MQYYMYDRHELFSRQLECYFENKHQNNPIVSAKTVRHYSPLTSLYEQAVG